MSLHDDAVRRLRRRLAAVLVLKRVLPPLTAWAFLWGTAVLILRLAAGAPALPLLGGLAAFPVVGALAAIRAVRRLPPAAAVRAALDRAGGHGGLLMAAAERDPGLWQSALHPVPGLRVRWHGARSWLALAAGVAFLAGALAFPQELASATPVRPLEVGKEVDQLASRIDVLKEEGLLEPERAEVLKEKLQSLKGRASGEDPARTLEALDRLQEVTTKAAHEGVERAVKRSETLGLAQGLAEGLRRAEGRLDQATRAEAVAELAELLRKAAREDRPAAKGSGGKAKEEPRPHPLSRKKSEAGPGTGAKKSRESLDRDRRQARKEAAELLRQAAREAGMEKALDGDGRKGPRGRAFSRQELQKLAEALRRARKDQAKMLRKLEKAGLLDPEAGKQPSGAGKPDAGALANLLQKHGGKMPVAEMLREAQAAGKGGVDEGGGPTPLTWKNASTEEGVKFKEVKLPPASLAALKGSRVVGVGQAAPEVNREAGPSAPGALAGAKAGGGSAQTEVVLPRHRAAVGRYFARPSPAR